jgi:predicted glycosyl hydrolase (DUF1957 family)
MFYNGNKWENVVKSGKSRGIKMDYMTGSLSDLAREINGALVRLGKSNWRRQFNIQLWSCNRERALELINAYHDRLVRLARNSGLDETDQHLFSPLRS